MSNDIIESCKNIKSVMDEFQQSVDTALELCYDYNRLANELDEVLRRYKILNKSLPLDFPSRYYSLFRGHDDWHTLELIEEGGIRYMVVHRNDTEYINSEAELVTYELKIPVPLLMNPTRYIRNLKTEMYCYVLDAINDARKDVYRCDIIIATTPEYKDTTMADDDRQRGIDIIAALDLFRLKI